MKFNCLVVLLLVTLAHSKLNKKFHKMNPKDFMRSSNEVVVHRNAKELRMEEEKNRRGE